MCLWGEGSLKSPCLVEHSTCLRGQALCIGNSPIVSGTFYKLKNYSNLPTVSGLEATCYACSFLYTLGSLWSPVLSHKGELPIGPVGSYFDLRVLHDTRPSPKVSIPPSPQLGVRQRRDLEGFST